MGDLSEDVERCLADCSCDRATAERAKTSCEAGRVRETKRVLLHERQRLLDAMHASQQGIDCHRPHAAPGELRVRMRRCAVRRFVGGRGCP